MSSIRFYVLGSDAVKRLPWRVAMRDVMASGEPGEQQAGKNSERGAMQRTLAECETRANAESIAAALNDSSREAAQALLDALENERTATFGTAAFAQMERERAEHRLRVVLRDSGA